MKPLRLKTLLLSAGLAATMALGAPRLNAVDAYAYLGEVGIFAGNFAPLGWAFCDGQLLPIAQNTALFSLLGTTYGGDGLSTFALPDLNDRVVIGADSTGGMGLTPHNPGETDGSNTVILTTDNLPSHAHTQAGLQVVTTTAGVKAPSSSAFLAKTVDDKGSLVKAYGAPTGSSVTVAVGVTSTSITGQSQPVNVRSPYLGLKYIIRIAYSSDDGGTGSNFPPR